MGYALSLNSPQPTTSFIIRKDVCCIWRKRTHIEWQTIYYHFLASKPTGESLLAHPKTTQHQLTCDPENGFYQNVLMHLLGLAVTDIFVYPLHDSTTPKTGLRNVSKILCNFRLESVSCCYSQYFSTWGWAHRRSHLHLYARQGSSTRTHESRTRRRAKLVSPPWLERARDWGAHETTRLIQ